MTPEFMALRLGPDGKERSLETEATGPGPGWSDRLERAGCKRLAVKGKFDKRQVRNRLLKLEANIIYYNRRLMKY